MLVALALLLMLLLLLFWLLLLMSLLLMLMFLFWLLLSTKCAPPARQHRTPHEMCATSAPLREMCALKPFVVVCCCCCSSGKNKIPASLVKKRWGQPFVTCSREGHLSKPREKMETCQKRKKSPERTEYRSKIKSSL